jgi:hypothetical protein
LTGLDTKVVWDPGLAGTLHVTWGLAGLAGGLPSIVTLADAAAVWSAAAIAKDISNDGEAENTGTDAVKAPAPLPVNAAR